MHDKENGVNGQAETSELLADTSLSPRTPAPAYASLDLIASHSDLPELSAELPGDSTAFWSLIGGNAETQSNSPTSNPQAVTRCCDLKP
jgi:hypothetical protein